MRFFILSDIHANLEALEAVVAAVPAPTYEGLLVLGDLVGYGASPNEVVERVFAMHPDISIRGNHDKVAAGLEPPHHFNEVAAGSALWTLQTLTPENRSRVASLPAGPVFVDQTTEMCHGSPLDEDMYVFDQADALRALEASKRPVCWFGHTHIAGAFVLEGSRLDVIAPPLGATGATVIKLDGRRKYLINPGSVGQPRDSDPRAAYAIYDTDRREVRLSRVAYRVDLAQQKITGAGLPESLARRLGVGR
jgi:diadenosine tetraphosphatase ApaH/serine/threonine PP2A family protein phosphatase